MVRKLIPTCCITFSLSTRMQHKFDDITNKLKDLEEEKNTLGLRAIDYRQKNMNRIYETSLPDDESGIVGREADKQALIKKLLVKESGKDNFSIVPIVGMGGVGKTTLARLVYNETQVKDHFQLMGWACISDEFDVFSISQTIYRDVTSESKEFKGLNEVQVDLQGKLKDKLFLVVLDDIWTDNHNDWEKLVPPFRAGAPGSKIIVTSRKVDLLKQLGCNHLDHLNTLSPNDALSLFALHAFGVDKFDSHPKLITIGEGIVKKCAGLPLALKALGRLLRPKTDKEDWEDVLNSEIWTLEDEDGILPALRLSYHDLPADLKQLFAYCSSFPKDYLFDKEELVLLWMAEGFLHPSTSTTSTERWGHDCFNKLLSKSFFQHAPNNTSLFVMHDLMNELATSIAGDFNLRLDIEMKNDFWKKGLEKCRHMSFVCEWYMVSKKFNGLERAKNLRTFLALPSRSGQDEFWPERFNLSNKILADMLIQFPLLRILSLSRLEISEVPEFVGDMKHLRYLNLSRTNIRRLPEYVCNLYNLQTLIVFRCRELVQLPKSFLKLINLRHFDIRDTPLLNKLPSGSGELKSLQTLSKIIIGGDDDGFSITELKDLKNLHGIISIQGLEKVQNLLDAEDANLSQKRLTELELKWSDDSRMETIEKEVLNALTPRNDNLVKLGIVSYGGIEFPTWVGDPSFDLLTHVSLRGCHKCTSLPPLGKLPSLKELFIESMDGVRIVGMELFGYGTTGQAFRSLETLSFQHMHGWKVWSSKSGVVGALFPCLRKLSIEGCPNLDEVSLDALPTLKILRIESCGHDVCRSLISVASAVITLKIVSISGLTDELWGSVIKYLVTVEELEIQDCEIKYLWESEAKSSNVLVKLRKFYVSRHSNLVSLGEKEEDNYGINLSSLRTLDIRFCERMECCSCPNRGQKLKSLVIIHCKKLLEELQGGEKMTLLINDKIMSMLEYVHIRSWPNLKSITGLSNFIHLGRLIIYNCPNMEAFPDHELPNLTSLTSLIIMSCRRINASFPRGFWPPKLRELFIGRLKKPISKWGPQNFPNSLVKLLLNGGSSKREEDVLNFSQLYHFLPPSLTSLHIQDFEKLESLSMGLQHLNSLQHLILSTCPRMIDLPEMFPSLLSLEIYECPNLNEKLSKRGSYWPLISHIPCIKIDDVSQY